MSVLTRELQASGVRVPDHPTGTAVNARIADTAEAENAAIVSAPTTMIQLSDFRKSGACWYTEKLTDAVHKLCHWITPRSD